MQIAQARQPPSLIRHPTTSIFSPGWCHGWRIPPPAFRLSTCVCTSVEQVDLHLGAVDAAIRYRETPEPDLCCTLLRRGSLYRGRQPDAGPQSA